MARVLVTDASRGSAISIIQSLGRRGIGVVAADPDPRAPGLKSRYARAGIVYPHPRDDPEATVDVLLRAARDHRVDLIIPATDDVILPLTRARDRFDGVCALAVAKPEALATASDKLATLELARRLGIPTPRTALVTTAEEAAREADALGWPIVLKPRVSREFENGGVARFTVEYADRMDTLVEQMRRLEGRCSVLLQQYHAGEGQGIELLAHRGRALAAFQHRRLREVPITGGASSFRESVPLDPELLDHSVRLLSELEWTGLAMVEFKIGSEGPLLMEVNGRIWGSLPLAVKSGMDFPARLADLYLQGPPNGHTVLDTAYRVGVRSRNLDLEILWIIAAARRSRPYPFLAAPDRREAARVALRLFTPRDGFDILALDDPRPGLAEVSKIVRKLRRKVREQRKER